MKTKKKKDDFSIKIVKWMATLTRQQAFLIRINWIIRVIKILIK